VRSHILDIELHEDVPISVVKKKPGFLVFFDFFWRDFLSSKNDVNLPSKSKKS
jgi:hypothetical protein